MPDTSTIKAGKAAMRQRTQSSGRDAVSQDIEGLMPAIKTNTNRIAPAEVPLNRQQRRALNKYQQK
jgi:hypothetical protein